VLNALIKLDTRATALAGARTAFAAEASRFVMSFQPICRMTGWASQDIPTVRSEMIARYPHVTSWPTSVGSLGGRMAMADQTDEENLHGVVSRAT